MLHKAWKNTFSHPFPFHSQKAQTMNPEYDRERSRRFRSALLLHPQIKSANIKKRAERSDRVFFYGLFQRKLSCVCRMCSQGWAPRSMLSEEEHDRPLGSSHNDLFSAPQNKSKKSIILGSRIELLCPEVLVQHACGCFGGPKPLTILKR